LKNEVLTSEINEFRNNTKSTMRYEAKILNKNEK